MAIRKIIRIGHPALKKLNKKVTNVNSVKIKKLIKDLKDTMIKVNLIGIAAPQIAENHQVFVTYPRKTKARNQDRADKLRVYINPKITYFSKEKNVIYEGCGCVVASADYLFGPVLRSKEIEVEATDEKGQKFSLRCDGLLARVIQHEFDHLAGIEFIEKVSDYKKAMFSDVYEKNIRNSAEQKKASKITKVIYKKI
jgi:peptide deformylase